MKVTPPQASWHDFQRRVEISKIAALAERSFGFNLLRAIVVHSPGQNVFVSPLSVFLALQMAANGARGSTRKAMWDAMGLSGSDTSALNASAEVMQSLLNQREGVDLTIANALWADAHFTLEPEFVKLCQSKFHARAATFNFGDPNTAFEINNWVKTNTKDKISDIVSANDLAGATLILTNAVYFAGHWANEFSESQTRNEAFHTTGGGVKKVPMMHCPLISKAYRSGSNFEGALLRYEGFGLFLYALLPTRGNTPRDVLESFDPISLAKDSDSSDLELKLPRFKIDFSARLGGYLMKMGMEIAFNYPEADFLPMGSKDFYINEMLHKTRLEVDEKGTVAAAASATMLFLMDEPPPPSKKKMLVFDRPFVVLIGDSQTNALLFAGVIEDP